MSITFRVSKDDNKKDKHMSITFRIGKDDNKKDKHMSISFRIGKDDIARKINTCLLPLELVKTTLQEVKLSRYWGSSLQVFANCPMEDMSLAILGNKVEAYFQTVRWRTCHLKYW
jgi:hypothetical protein